MTPSSAPAVPQKWPAEILTPAEVAALIGACSAKSRTGIRNRALLSLLYRSGLRISEVIGFPGREEVRFTDPDGNVKTQPARPAIPPLKEAHINFGQHDIRVLHTKSGKPQTRGFHPSIDDTLHRWIDVRGNLGLNGRQPLFCSLRGDPLYAQYVRAVLGRLKEAVLGRLKEKADIERRVYTTRRRSRGSWLSTGPSWRADPP